MLLLPLEKYLLHPSRPIQTSIARLRVTSNLIFKPVGRFHLKPADYPLAEYARRLKQRAYDEIRRVLAKTYLINEMETVDWLNNFLNRFWPLSEPYLSWTIVMAIDRVLSTNTPTFIDDMRISTFTLGNRAPRIESARISPDTEDGVVVMDWAISFKPFEVSNTTPEQAAEYVDPKVVFSTRVGIGLSTAEIPIQAEDITFKGHIKLRLQLMSNFPHVQVADFSLIRRPKIDFVLKQTGGNTFGSIANIPAVSSFIHEMVHSHFGATMIDNPFFTINIEEMLSKQAIDEAIGVIKVTLYNARGLKVPRIGGAPDPYVSLNINGREEIARTQYKRNTSNPTWMETKFVLINNLEEYLHLNVYNYDEHRRNALLGVVGFKLGTLQDDAQQSITSRLLKDGKEKGELKYDISYYPVLATEESDGRLPDTNVGIVRLIVHQATGLNSRSMSGELNPVVKVYLGEERAAVYKGPVKRNENNPIWNATYEFLCLDKVSSKIGIRVINDRDSLKDSEIGYMVVRLTDLLTCTSEAGKEWFDLNNCNYGKIRVSAKWNALDLPDDPLENTKQYMPPIGVVRLLLDQANDVKNIRAALASKSDLYVRVLVNNTIKGRSDIITNDSYPWEPIIYIPVHSLKETLQLEYMDYQHSTEDRSLGSVKINVAELAKPSDNSQDPFESTGIQKRADRTVIERDNPAGVLHYSAEFVPSMHIKGSSFKPRQNELQAISSGMDVDARSFISSSSSFEDDCWLTNLTIHMSKENVNVSNNAPASAQSDSENTDIASTNEEKGVEMDVNELLTHRSGIILFNVLSGQLNRKARFEVLINDDYWPCFSTTKARSTQPQWNYIGEGFMRELDFGLVCMRLNEGDDGNKDEIIGIWKQDAKSFLEKASTAPQSFTLYDPKNDRKAVAHVIIEARYVPVPVKLEPRESITNQGVLRVLLISGQDLHAADRSGKSDPFVVFTLNGHKVIRSQVRKKTLDPEWGEEFEITIESRIHAEFSLEVFDWNQIKQSESLGKGPIDLMNLKPFIATDQIITLSSPKHGKKGQIRLNFLFTPKMIVKSKKNTSTFTSTVRTMTQMNAFVGFRRT
ncbi:hypothetical protein M378DRAFT_85652 [Amanita muscaria Koide BX008]|uniref:Uncharacterized protein n=1 Tax=Amanita muscaria (strain Koide BX008) TaxID=946122 RepID=A0A0C2WRV6_AMAMK|nr:hypothetical protein M378DRAFT_85652 [Amanita muscaria Koide BX008]